MEHGLNTDGKPPWSRRKKLKVALIVALVVIGGTFIWFRMSYPYGGHPVCSKGVGLGLRGYALEHEGWFPRGESSPEASLSLLCVDDTNALVNIRGKNITMAVASANWAKNGRLGPESCGWHYVEGLREDDDSSLAIVWDKVFGVDHFGQRRRGLAHEVVYLDGSSDAISMEKWPKFAMEQREKIAKAIASRTNGMPPIRWSDEETLGTNWFPRPK